MSSNWRSWISDRFGLRPIWEHFLLRRVPKTPWYAGSGQAMLLLLGIQLLTGAVLALSYSPSVESAYQSVVYITEVQTLGWLVRALHYWSGGLFVVLIAYHFFRQILVGGYKSPREGSWLIGVLLLFIVVAMSFLGYVLRWDERGLYGIRVALFHFARVPWIGDRLVALIQGGPEITTLTVSRLYAMHVLILPALLVGLVFHHLYLIVLHGTVTPSEKEQPVETVEEQRELYEQDAHSRARGETFFPHTPIRMSPFPIASFLAVLLLAFIVGAPRLYPPTNFVSESFPKEEWWLAWYSGLAALLPSAIASYFYVGFPVLLFIVLVMLPFVDRGPYRGIRNRPIAATVVAICVLAILYLTAVRARSPWTAAQQAQPPSMPPGVQLTERVERGRVLFASYGCNSCHAVAGEGPQVGPDIARLRQRYSLEGIRRYVLAPPPNVAMPSYAGRIPEEDLALVVEFCHVAQTFPRDR